ncbi:PEPxxWA-CTERM sorting domain-containing protein [Phenylobacterium sp.]|jgi:hypothetical protein|uniref:PEPxxWA-CTERM sorting domain-containing protein n=1 Tax=Phenylobacterium sp. TaxID=1871053 RepID=UPI00121FF5DC|nr:PEPxxWA-CTERM sorting domain-containing protein [Phenylobacterium sp.]THD55625.1 MAG: PEP-CTERM sorting domain-containing protein [Phenylobacterium sp.]
MKTQALLAGAAIALAVSFGAASAQADTNLITNGDFSAGLADWSEVDSCCYFTDSTGFREGSVGANGMLSQTFIDDVGGSLTLDFDFGGDAGGSTGYQYVSFDGTTIAGSYVDTTNGSPYQHYTFALGAGTGSDTITFNGRNDPSYNTLDNVAITQTAGVPEPTSWALMLSGFFGAGAFLRRRRAVTATATA